MSRPPWLGRMQFTVWSCRRNGPDRMRHFKWTYKGATLFYGVMPPCFI
jgi:hypothetical protein